MARGAGNTKKAKKLDKEQEKREQLMVQDAQR